MRLFPVLLVFVLACKTTRTDQTSQELPVQFSILLEDKLKLNEIAALEPVEIKTAKRISKSQNLWLVTLASGPASGDARLSDLEASPGILEVKKLNTDTNKPSNSKNVKKAKTSPIK